MQPACSPPKQRGVIDMCGSLEGLDFFMSSYWSWSATQILSAIIPQDPCNIPVETCWAPECVSSAQQTVYCNLRPSFFHFLCQIILDISPQGLFLSDICIGDYYSLLSLMTVCFRQLLWANQSMQRTYSDQRDKST